MRGRRKALFMDVLEHMGRDSYYGDPQIRSLYEWIYGYTLTPFRYGYTFGDSAPNGANLIHPVIARAHKFGALAQGYAAWQLQGVSGAPPAWLSWYVLLGGSNGEPRSTPSRATKPWLPPNCCVTL